MITRVEIQNYRCFRALDVPLAPLTVLIGPNDSGKSTLLHAIRSVAEKRGFESSDCWSGSVPIDQVHVGVYFSDDSSIRRQADSYSYAPGHGKREVALSFHNLPSSGVQTKCKGFETSEEGRWDLREDGRNLAAGLDYFVRKDRKRFDQIIKALQSFVPGLDDIQISTPSAAERQIDVVIENGLEIPADRLSVGVRALLFFITLANHPNPPEVILIEEPENGVHPHRLGDILRLLRGISEGSFGTAPTQVILTTHSPYLLDHIDVSKDQVLVFRRDPDGSRTAEPIDKERLSVFLDEFMLGEVWYNQQEQGMVAKDAE